MIIFSKIKDIRERLIAKSQTESKKSAVIAFSVLTAVYLAFMAAALAVYLTGRSQVVEAIADNGVTLQALKAGNAEGLLPAALEVLLGICFLMLSSVYFTCFACHNPFRLKKSLQILFIVIGVLVSVGVDAAFFYDFYENKIALAAGDSANFALIVGNSAGLGFAKNILLVLPYDFLISQIALTLFFILFVRGLSSKYFLIFGLCGSIVSPLFVAVALVLLMVLYGIYMIFAYIKALIWGSKEVGNAVGNDEFVAGVKRGMTGGSLKDDGYSEYTYKNSAGSEVTVYSKDGKKFVNADGSYAGRSDDGGKTIHK